MELKSKTKKTGWRKNSDGFTIMEIVVVLAIFLFIIGAAMGIFLSVIENQRRVLSEDQFLNQISYVEEYMSKALRMAKTETTENCLTDESGTDHPGYIYLLTHSSYDSVAGKTIYKGIKFINESDNNACQEFYLDTSARPYVLMEQKKGGSAIALTSSSMNINFVKFAINGKTDCGGTVPCGASNQDPFQPRVTILLNVGIAGDSQSMNVLCSADNHCSAGYMCNMPADATTGTCMSTRTIQTTVSRRYLNVH